MEIIQVLGTHLPTANLSCQSHPQPHNNCNLISNYLKVKTNEYRQYHKHWNSLHNERFSWECERPVQHCCYSVVLCSRLHK